LSDEEAAAIRRQANGVENFAVDGSFARAAANPAITLVGRQCIRGEVRAMLEVF